MIVTGLFSDFVEHYNDWDLGVLDIHDMFKRAENILVYPMVDRNPISHWTDKCVTLIGDAAHPMYPRGGNGASQAIVNARVLTECLTDTANIQQALLNYQNKRIPITSSIVESNRHGWQKKIFQLIEENCKQQCVEQHTCVSKENLSAVISDYEKKATQTSSS